jgi:hypothetical protein
MMDVHQLKRVEQVLQEAGILPDGWHVVGCSMGSRGVVGGSIRLAIACGEHMRGVVESAQASAVLAGMGGVDG